MHYFGRGKSVYQCIASRSQSQVLGWYLALIKIYNKTEIKNSCVEKEPVLLF